MHKFIIFAIMLVISLSMLSACSIRSVDTVSETNISVASENAMIQKPGMYGPHKDERGRTIEHPDLSWNEILERGYLKKGKLRKRG